MQPLLNKPFSEKPILFSAPMVRAILDGSKTQTWRGVKHKWPCLWDEPWYATGKVISDLPTQSGAFMEFRYRQQDDHDFQGSPASTLVPCPYGQPGDRLWVRETWRTQLGYDAYSPKNLPNLAEVEYVSDGGGTFHGKSRPSIFMPRWASRITLEITAVRVERLQDISYEDALAEGVADARPLLAKTEPNHGETADETSRHLRWPQREYALLWDEINGAGEWDKNPWVWVIEFKRALQ